MTRMTIFHRLKQFFCTMEVLSPPKPPLRKYQVRITTNHETDFCRNCGEAIHRLDEGCS